MKNISVLGAGAMGERIASNLLESGYNVTVYNRTSKRVESLEKSGAIIALTPESAVQNADIVLSLLRDNNASRAVWFDKENGAILGLKKTTVVVECSTLSSTYCIELADRIIASGADFLDAPIVGSRPQAEARQLIHLAGGDNEVLKRVNDVLSVNAVAIHHVGSIGAGMNMKLAVNAIFGIQVAGLGEVLSVLDKADISKEKAVDILNELPVTSPALKGIGMLMASNNHNPLFPIELVEKDFSYMQSFAKSVGSDSVVTASALLVYQDAIDKGLKENNISGVIKLFEKVP